MLQNALPEIVGVMLSKWLSEETELQAVFGASGFNGLIRGRLFPAPEGEVLVALPDGTVALTFRLKEVVAFGFGDDVAPSLPSGLAGYSTLVFDFGEVRAGMRVAISLSEVIHE